MVHEQYLVQMAAGRIKPPVSITVIVVFGMIILSLHLMSSATQNASGLGEMYSSLLLINSLGSVLLLVLVAANIHALVRQVRKKKAGSRLTLRMVFLFVLLSMAPASIVFYYSMQFLHHSIDSWFDVQIDGAVEDALELGQAALHERKSHMLRETRQMAEALAKSSSPVVALELEDLHKRSAASELTLISRSGQFLAWSSLNPEAVVPRLPDESILLRVRQGEPYVGLESIGESDMQIRTLVAVDGEQPGFLQAWYPVPVRIRDLTRTVETAYGHYKEMNYLRNSLKMSFSLTLSLVLLLSLLAAIWVAFISIRRIVAPVRDLALGTMAVGAGDYEKRLPVVSRDEWGFLVESFNEMTERLAATRDEADRSRLEVENQRAYLATVLGNLSSGVLSFDTRYRLRTANQAADDILGVEFRHYSGLRLSALGTDRPNLENFVESLQHRLQYSDSVWQEEITFMGANGRQILLCRGTPLFSTFGRKSGAVMVFDDMTDLIRAQRNAAWGEVARRLAHEIKNPLTPIQLSAERLQKKLGPRLCEDDAAVMKRAINTIVQQVEAMKSMVNAFSDYARPRSQETQTIHLNQLIGEVLALYPSQGAIQLEFLQDPELPGVDADPVRMRQVLHNLVKNAREAVELVGTGKVVLSTRRVREQTVDSAEVRIEDSGPGVAEDLRDSLFEPYVTNKVKGTGLGLAIVKKIIEEHGGIIYVDGQFQRGSAFVFRLPAIHELESGVMETGGGTGG